MTRILLTIALCISAVACGGSSSSPTAPTSPSNAITVYVYFQRIYSDPGESFTATLNGQTFTAYSVFTVQLPPGTHQISGSFVGGGLGVGLGGGVLTPAGGVLSGSVRSLSGPGVSTQPCSILYFPDNISTARRTFQVQFEVTRSVGSACS